MRPTKWSLIVIFILILIIILQLRGCFSTIGITSFTPGSALPGTIVTIKGHGFNSDPFSNTVTIGSDPARVISGDIKTLRVVLYRKFQSDLISVSNGSHTATSSEKLLRDGSTTQATPLLDSDSKLVEGAGYPTDKRYDMKPRELNQKILIVFAKPNDVDPETFKPGGYAGTARQAMVDILPNITNYFIQASYNTNSASFGTTPDWVTLSQKRDFYCWQQEDIDRAQAALDAINLDPSATAAQIDDATQKVNNAKDANNTLQEPDFLFAEALLGAKAAVPDFDTYTDYFIIVAGSFLRGQCCWNETGYHAESTNPSLNLKFDIDFPSPKGGVYVAQGADWGRMAHELSHFFAIGDIYSEGHADGTFTEGNFASFELMGNHDSHPLYSGYDITKNMHYFDESANGNVINLDWHASADKNETFDLVAHSSVQDPNGNGVAHVLKLKVSDGLSYFVEVRQQPDPAAEYLFDANIPLVPANPAWKGGIIIYKAVENNNQSNNNERPLSLMAPFHLMQVGEHFDDPARTIKITVEQKLIDRPAKYRVRVSWGHLPSANPDGQFDLRITPWGGPPWESADIWANSPKNDITSPAPKTIYKNHEAGDETIPIGNGDPPWVGHDNTLFARITNQGVQETPEDVEVTFYINTPPGVGDNGTWAPFTTMNVGKLAPGETKIIQADRTWRPSVGEHTCVDVRIHPMNGEVTFDNNRAQENFGEFETGSSSPYQPVEFDFIARNPYESPVVMNLVAHNVPDKWFVAFDHGSVWLKPKEDKKVHAVIWTDRIPEWISKDREKSPRKPLINIEGICYRWGDQVFAVGGISALVNAVRKVEIRLEISKEIKSKTPFRIQGNVSPSAGVVPLSVQIIDPFGKEIRERTQTNASGSFNYQTVYTPPLPGGYKLKVFILAGSMAAEAETNEYSINVQ
jgi:hypothetical protein